MNKARIIYIMNTVMVVGLLLIMTAIFLAVFAELQVTMGVTGVFIITATFGFGLLMLLPSKIYLTLVLMKKNGEGRN